MVANRSAKQPVTRLARTPGRGAQDWWRPADDTGTTPPKQNTTAAVAGSNTVELMALPIGQPPRTETVLVVDDEPLMREFIAEILRESGYQVLEAASAMEAQQLTQTNRHINLLLTDFSMPGTNGLELARWFQGRYPRMKVLIASGALWELANQVGEQERVAILLKPFEVAQLSRMVRLALG
jgi:CheY-like chemotaxis protein